LTEFYSSIFCWFSSVELYDLSHIRYVIQYKNDAASGQHPHSPWELQDVDGQWSHPHIDNRTRDMLLLAISELEETSIKKVKISTCICYLVFLLLCLYTWLLQDSHGIQKINMVVQKPDFINRY
jgi:hypothetical protein